MGSSNWNAWDYFSVSENLLRHIHADLSVSTSNFYCSSLLKWKAKRWSSLRNETHCTRTHLVGSLLFISDATKSARDKQCFNINYSVHSFLHLVVLYIKLTLALWFVYQMEYEHIGKDCSLIVAGPRGLYLY